MRTELGLDELEIKVRMRLGDSQTTWSVELD